MHSNGKDYPNFPPPDHTAILLDQTQELRRQSHALGWLVGQQQQSHEFRTEVRQDLTAIKARLQIVEARPSMEPHRPSRFNASIDSLSGLLHAGRPYLIACVLLLGKYLGLGPSWIEPLVEKIVKSL